MVDQNLQTYHHIFARQRLDTGINNETEKKLTLRHGKLVYTKNLPTSTILKEEMLVDFAHQKEYGLSTTLSISKYSSPVF